MLMREFSFSLACYVKVGVFAIPLYSVTLNAWTPHPERSFVILSASEGSRTRAREILRWRSE